MKHILAPILLLVFLSPTPTFGETMKDLVKRDGIYYKKFSTVPFTGKVTGKEQGSLKNGKKEGPWIRYWKNGQLDYKGTYKNGKEDGPWVSYWRNGQLNSKGTYKKGKKEGAWINHPEKVKSDEYRKLLKALTKRKDPVADLPPYDTYESLQEQIELSKKVRQQIVPCWNIPGGVKDAQKMKISIRIRLKRDGSLLGSPRVLDRGRYLTDQSFRIVAESAVRALLNPRCSPFKLPLKDYEFWKDITFNFDPSEALGP